jgi:hypothetical protein
VALAAEGYDPETIEVELSGGEITEITVHLNPIEYTDVNIDVQGAIGVSLYHGTLYVGETPYTLRLPVDYLGYVVAESRDGREARAVFTSPGFPGESVNYTLGLTIPPRQGEKRVDKARKQYYWAWGTTWAAIIAAWITNGVFMSHNDALLIGQSRGVYFDENDSFYKSTYRWYNISRGALYVLWAAIAYDVVQLTRYLYISSQGSVPIIRPEKK